VNNPVKELRPIQLSGEAHTNFYPSRMDGINSFLCPLAKACVPGSTEPHARQPRGSAP